MYEGTYGDPASGIQDHKCSGRAARPSRAGSLPGGFRPQIVRVSMVIGGSDREIEVCDHNKPNRILGAQCACALRANRVTMSENEESYHDI
jgi:hypothetical protein